MPARAFRVPPDPTIYPEEERVGEEMLQRWIAELLRPLVERYLAERGVTAFVGADQFIYYKQHEPTRRFAPDVYVLPGVPPRTRVRSWKIWERGLSPSFALEVASSEWEKDYIEAPQRCDEAGVQELIVFDPGYVERPSGLGVRFQVFRRTGKRGLRRIVSSVDDRVRSHALGCFLRAVGHGDDERLRLGVGPRGDDLVPTAEEAERAAKEAALARVAELERKLARKGRE